MKVLIFAYNSAAAIGLGIWYTYTNSLFMLGASMFCAAMAVYVLVAIKS